MLHKAINYLKYFYRKYQFLPKFCNLLAKEAKYPFVSNTCKYCLIFLATGLYLRSIRELCAKLASNKLRIDFELDSVSQNVELDMFTLADQEKLKEIFRKYQEYYNQEFSLYQGKIQNKVLPKLKEAFSTNSPLPGQISKSMKNLIAEFLKRL